MKIKKKENYADESDGDHVDYVDWHENNNYDDDEINGDKANNLIIFRGFLCMSICAS